MQRFLARSASIAVACILASALISGCNAARNLPATTSGVSQMNLLRSFYLGPEHKIGNELMTAGSDPRDGYCHGNLQQVFIIANGTATGPYPGTFSAHGGYNIPFRCFNTISGGIIGFSETFTITSGANTMSGSFIWNGKPVGFDCINVHCTLSASSSFIYKATLTRGGKVRKTFAGSASESGISMSSFGETLI